LHLSSWLQAAVIADRWRVAGIHCGALSVWHHFALEEIRNPYIYEVADEPDMDKAVELLLICSRDYAAGKKLFTFEDWCIKKRNEIYSALKRKDPLIVHDEVLDYVKCCTRIPAHKGAPVAILPGGIKQAQARKYIVAPQEWVLVDFLGPAGWDMPFAVARCIYDAHRNAAGEDNDLESRTDEARTDLWLQNQYEAQRKASAS